MAGIIFLDNYLRGVSFNARMMDRFVIRLQGFMNGVLDNISPFEIDFGVARTALWGLYVGATAAEKKPERGWFVTHLSYLCDSLQLDSWDDAKQILESFLWPSSWDKHGVELWDEICKDRSIMSQLLTDETLVWDPAAR